MPAHRKPETAPGETITERPHRITFRMNEAERAMLAEIAATLARRGPAPTQAGALRTALYRVHAQVCKGGQHSMPAA